MKGLQLLQVAMEIFMFVCIVSTGSSKLSVRSVKLQILIPQRVDVESKEFGINIAQWGVPSIDLMATPFNCQVPLFFPCLFCPQSVAQDALSQSWNFSQIYLFPPTALILKSWLKIMEEGVAAITIVPFCPRP